MVEMHGWITIRESYEVTDEENFGEILELIDIEIKKLNHCDPQIVWRNGECFIELLACTNHMSLDIRELISFFDIVGKVAKGSYGLLYVHNDEDKDNHNSFVVHRLARGKVEIYQDTLLSPIVPVIEDR
ncbi:MAG: hypothetical protein IJP31_08460 [Lachnospiraceae bacterium]|nr:hypothetical protein [Lachnospiraceae bacterium]